LGTVRVKDIRSGTGNSFPRYLTNVNGTLFFQANDGTSGYELWKSDGTESGTVRAKDVRSGSGSSYPRTLTNVNGTLFFQANDGISGEELWKSDGTNTGTVLAYDFTSDSGGSSPTSITKVGSRIFVAATSPTYGQELFTLLLPTAPSSVSLSNATVAEGVASGTVLGNFSSLDVDLGDQHEYSLVTGTGSSDNGKFAIVGNQLVTNAAVDYETQSSYSIRVRSTDLDGLSLETVFTISVLDQNEVTSDIVVNSMIANGTTTLSVTYTIVGDPSPAFTLGFYRSGDNQVGSDTTLASATISGAADLSTGVHTKLFTIGGGVGQIPLPGAGAVEVNSDYFLLAVADPDDLVPELDTAGVSEDNVGVFTGAYFSGSGLVMIHGGAAADTISVSSTAVATINGVAKSFSATAVTGFRVRAHGGNDSFNGSAYTKPIGVWGGPDNDTLTGGKAADLLEGGADNDSLTGGTGNDTYLFDTDEALGVDTLVESTATSGGVDLLDFSATSTQAVTISLALATSQMVNANLTVTLGAINNFESLAGGAGNDSLTGNALANTLIGDAGNDTLRGAAGNDLYLYNVDAPIGSDTLVEAATSGGVDTISFAPTLTQAVTVDLSQAAAQVVHSANLSLTLGSGTLFENLIGGALGDTLIGNGLANSLSGGAGNDSLFGRTGIDTLSGDGGNDTLQGEEGNDAYLFDVDLPLGTDTLTESSSGGVDLLSFAATTTVSVSVDLSQAAAQVVHANLQLVLGGADRFENVTGGAQNDTLNGNSLTNVLVGGAGNDTLTGGDGDDIYPLDADAALGSDTVVELPGGGVDTIDLALTTTKALTLDLSLTTAQAVTSPNLTLTLSSGAAVENVIGGSLGDTLKGNTLANRLTGGPGNDTLQGSAGDDTYVFNPSKALGTDTLSELAGGGVDWLDFSQSTRAITLNLATATVQTVSTTYLSLVLGDGNVFENAVGSSVADSIQGNALDNLLIGGAGNDSLYGLAGRDLLFGGSGADRLEGGDEEDVLASGLFTYYNESTRSLSRAPLDAIRAEWSRLDAAYTARIANLRNGGGLNGTNKLDSTTVLTDGTAIDTLFGQAGLDWFWKFGSDSIGDLNTGGTETVN
jgi:ELWxxDGT repeat protein